jgi:hypothetical protein
MPQDPTRPPAGRTADSGSGAVEPVGAGRSGYPGAEITEWHAREIR